MPITTSAKKALRASQRKAAFNTTKKTAVKKATKQLKKLIAEKKIKEARAFFPQVQKIFDKSAKTGLLKKNNAARKKSRLAALLKKVSA